MITSWRLCNRDHAELNGAGAKRYGGRWNPKGYAVVYSSECLPLATLEAFVHLDRRPVNQVCVQISFEEALVQEVEALYSLPPSWKEDEPATRNIGAQWICDASSAVLSVPSVVVSISRNYLINPNHPEFSSVQCSESTFYEFDDRLLSRVSATPRSRNSTVQPNNKRVMF